MNSSRDRRREQKQRARVIDVSIKANTSTKTEASMMMHFIDTVLPPIAPTGWRVAYYNTVRVLCRWLLDS